MLGAGAALGAASSVVAILVGAWPAEVGVLVAQEWEGGR